MTEQQIRPEADRAAPRRAWGAPRLILLRAGAAEIGASPVKPEQAFARGS
jgi:hypothetical protein